MVIEPHFDIEVAWLEQILTQKIPLGAAMTLSVSRLDREGIVLAAPLKPNVNDKGSAFGGALASIMILAGWSLPRLLLYRHGLEADLVIGRCAMRFIAPVQGDFSAHCRWPQAAEQAGFVQQLQDNPRARLALAPELVYQGRVVATLEARYSALSRN